MPDPIPNGPDELTAAWLSSALAHAGHGEVVVHDLAVQPIGTGQTGTAYRLDATYDRPGVDLPVSFVAKLPAADPEVRQRVAAGYQAEVAFYDSVAATLSLPLPTCWYSAVADGGAEFVLLLSDLAPATQGDQLAGCGPRAATAAAVALAGLHGPRWCDPTWKEFTATTMPQPDEPTAAFLGEIARSAADQLLAELGPRLSDSARAVVAAFPDAVPEWLLLHPQRFSLLHGDYRLDNLMFSPDGDSVTVVDWQTLAVGLPARDLAYFTATSLLPDVRREHESAIVESYHEALVGHGVGGYDLDTCLADYRVGVLHAPFITSLGWAFSAATDRGNDMVLVMLERAAEAMTDLDTCGLVAELSRAT